MLKNNKLLSTKVIELSNIVSQFKGLIGENGDYFIKQIKILEKYNRKSGEDSKYLMNLLEESENQTKQIISERFDVLKQLEAENGEFKHQMKAIEEYIELAYKSSLSNPFANSLGSTQNINDIRKKAGINKGMLQRIATLFMNLQTQIMDLGTEKKHLLDNASKVKNDFSEIKLDQLKKEKLLIESLAQKETSISQKQSTLDEKESIIIQKTNLIAKKVEEIYNLQKKLDEGSHYESELQNLMNTKEFVILDLTKEKETLYKNLNETNLQISNYQAVIKKLEKQISELYKELSYKEEQFVLKNGEIAIRNKEILDLKESMKSLRNSSSIQLQEIENIINHSNKPNSESEKARSLSSSLSLKLNKSINQDASNTETLLNQLNHLRTENKELLLKLNQLNTLIARNQELEQEIQNLKPDSADFFKKTQALQKKPADKDLFDEDYISNCLNIDEIAKENSSDSIYDKKLIHKTTEGSIEKLNQLFVDNYKNKTKRIFQKRIKELELILRYIDEKVKGFNFVKLGYIYGTMLNENPASEEIKASSKLSILVDELLDKNLVLKHFISSICNNVEKLYLKYHNLTITLAKIFKMLFMNSIHSENFAALNQFGLLSDLEILFENAIPLVAENFATIDIKSEPLWKNRNLDFFRNFGRIESKMNFLQDYLLNSKIIDNETKIKYQSLGLRSKEFGNLKINKFKEIVQLYQKLSHFMEKNKNLPLNLLEENMKNYTSIFQNVFNATYSEVKDILNFLFNAFDDSGNEKQISFSQISDKKSSHASSSNVNVIIPNNVNMSKATDLSEIFSFIHDESSFSHNKYITTDKKVKFSEYNIKDYQTPTLENKLVEVINSQIEILEKSISNKSSSYYGHERYKVSIL